MRSSKATQDPQNGDAGSDEAGPSGQTQRQNRERDNAIGGKAQHLEKRKFGNAGMPSGAAVMDGDVRKTEPADHATHEAIAFGHIEKSVYDAAIH